MGVAFFRPDGLIKSPSSSTQQFPSASLRGLQYVVTLHGWDTSLLQVKHLVKHLDVEPVALIMSLGNSSSRYELSDCLSVCPSGS